jgi:hypothetical protein
MCSNIQICRYLLALSCPPVCMYVRPSTYECMSPTGRISAKFDIGDFYETVEKFQILLNSVKSIGQFE